MKKLLNRTALLVVMFSAGLVAQERPDHHEGPHKGMHGKKHKKMDLEKMKARLVQKLGLSSKQQSDFDKIIAKYKPEMEDLKSSHENLKKEGKALREKRKVEVQKILTSEQMAKMEDFRKSKKQDWKNLRQGMKKAERPNKEQMFKEMSEALGLSNAQKQDFKKIHESYEPQMKAHKENREALKEKGKSLHQEIEKEVDGILTSEQVAKKDEMKKNFKERMRQKFDTRFGPVKAR